MHVVCADYTVPAYHTEPRANAGKNPTIIDLQCGAGAEIEIDLNQILGTCTLLQRLPQPQWWLLLVLQAQACQRGVVRHRRGRRRLPEVVEQLHDGG